MILKKKKKKKNYVGKLKIWKAIYNEPNLKLKICHDAFYIKYDW